MKQYSQLVQTKLSIPGLRARYVRRGRLIGRAGLESGAALTLVSAPAGYGKTTLITELTQAALQSKIAIAWYSLDSKDNDPNLFCSYLIASLGSALQIDTALSPVARLLRSTTSPDLEKIFPVIINALVSANKKCLLVLDDYQFVTSPAIHTAIAYLVDHLPANTQVVIGSRSDPPLPLARLRASGKMVELRAADLRFTPDETASFLNETMSLGLSPEAIFEIERSTEGWVTGLQLAALSIMGRPDITGFISSFGAGNRYLVEYLLQEVIRRQTEEIQRFLLATSILERMCAPLCDAVTDGHRGSDEFLNKLLQANLFIIPLDDENYWFRYHHLFRDFLSARLRQSNPDKIPFLHRVASAWYESQNLLSEAVSHAIATSDWAYAAGVVEKHGMKIFKQSELSILLRWCAVFPQEIFCLHPMLCILQGWALSMSYREENRHLVEERMQQAEKAANKLEDRDLGNRLTAQVALVRLSLCLIPNPSINPERFIEFAQKTLDLLAGNDSGRAIATSAIGYAYLSRQDLPMAVKTIEEFRRLSLAGGFYYGVVAATFYLANLALYQGQLKRAKEMCQQVQKSMSEIFANPKVDLPALGSLDISRGCVLLEENRLEEAELALVNGLELAAGTNNPFYRLVACAALFRLRQIQERDREAFAYLDDIEDIWPDISFYAQGLRLMHLIRTDHQDSRTLDRAAEWCTQFSPYICENMLLPGIGPFGGTEAYYMASLIWVRGEILLGNASTTLSYLEKQKNIAEAQGLKFRLIELLLAEAQARKALGETRQCFELLERGLKLAESTGCIRIFDQGPALTGLLKAAVHRDIKRKFVEQILKALGVPFENEQSNAHSLPRVKMGQATLTERELEILHYLACGASNKQMADKLFVTIGTIKSHINHILNKLDAHNRLEAIALAREMGFKI